MPVTSTSAASGPPLAPGLGLGILDEIKKLFSWNPPYLNSAKTITLTGTRPPPFYNKHFKEELVLQRVERFSSLPNYLKKNVDKALKAALKKSTLPPPLNGFITADQRKNELNVNVVTYMEDERDVANHYFTTTAKYCLTLASTLALHPTTTQWNTLVFWTGSVPNSNYAIAEGQLRFRVDENEYRDAIMECVKSEIHPIVEEMREAKSPLATMEIKSLRAGPVQVMTAVRNLGKFSWTYCDAPNCPDCLESNKHTKALKEVEKVVVGHDAPDPPWKLPKRSLNASEEPDIDPLSSATSGLTQLAEVPSFSKHASRTKNKGKKRKRDDDDDDEASPTRRQPVTRSTTKAPALSSKHASSTKDKGKKRKLEETSPTRQQPVTRSTTSKTPALKHVSPAKNKGKKRQQDDDEDFEDRYDQSAKKLVQQAWAQAVKSDGTIIILHSGNYELVCVRDRHSQTLYVSDVIEPPTYPEYGKLHVGICIAAIQETIDRKLLQSNPPGDGDDSTGGDEDNQEDQDHNRGSRSRHKDDRRHHRGSHRGRGVGRSRFQGSAGRSGPTDELVEKAIDLANRYNTILLYIRYDIYDSPIPSSFFRSSPSIMANKRCPPPFSPQDIHTCSLRLEEFITIVLTSEIGRGATSVVHRGTLTCKPDGATSLDVVVKLAFDVEQRDALRNEYEVYRHLRSKGVHQGITTALGFFNDSEDASCALVALYAGIPLSSESQGDLSIPDCKSALSTLESIHDAGILHGDIRRENILIGDFGITIIDFAHSKQSANQEAKDEELFQLRYFLGLAGKE